MPVKKGTKRGNYKRKVESTAKKFDTTNMYVAAVTDFWDKTTYFGIKNDRQDTQGYATLNALLKNNPRYQYVFLESKVKKYKTKEEKRTAETQVP